jgi:hypothetical protein
MGGFVAYYGNDRPTYLERRAVTSEKKLMFRYAEAVSGPILKPRLPMVFDLVDDSGETRTCSRRV